MTEACDGREDSVRIDRGAWCRGLVLLMAVATLVEVASCGGSSRAAGVPPPGIEPGYEVDCGAAPGGPVEAGGVVISLADLACGTALHVEGGKATMADPGGGRFVNVRVTVTTSTKDARSPRLAVACGDGVNVEAQDYPSAANYQPDKKLTANAPVSGWLSFPVRSTCATPTLVAATGGSETPLMTLFR